MHMLPVGHATSYVTEVAPGIIVLGVVIVPAPLGLVLVIVSVVMSLVPMFLIMKVALLSVALIFVQSDETN